MGDKVRDTPFISSYILLFLMVVCYSFNFNSCSICYKFFIDFTRDCFYMC